MRGGFGEWCVGGRRCGMWIRLQSFVSFLYWFSPYSAVVFTHSRRLRIPSVSRCNCVESSLGCHNINRYIRSCCIDSRGFETHYLFCSIRHCLYRWNYVQENSFLQSFISFPRCSSAYSAVTLTHSRPLRIPFVSSCVGPSVFS
jgi:hypothetical protein